MKRAQDPAGDAIAFAERLLALLDEGRVATTYKYAVMLGLIDVCIEQTSAAGSPPSVVTTRQLAEKVVELYWPHTVPYRGRRPSAVLRQSGTGRAEILTLIQAFRDRLNADPLAPLGRARRAAPTRFEQVLRDVEWKLIEMPLPRLQTLRKHHLRFIYDIGWDENIRVGVVRRYQQGDPGVFDNRILLLSGVAEHLVRLNGVVRPLLHRHWTSLVARLNGLEESKLEHFLFGTRRTALTALRAPLADLQEGRCFYCADRLRQQTEVDHFIPWSRFPDDALDNLVAAHDRCNAAKRDFLAAAPHLRRWRERLGTPELDDVAENTGWHRNPDTTLGMARAIYLRLPAGVPLWQVGTEFTPANPTDLGPALA